MHAFELRHIVSFEDTNVAGNVYYVNHLRWQGRCREMFLKTYAPDLVQRLASDLALVTVRCTCEYLAELFVFDEVNVRMRLSTLGQSRVSMRFEYGRIGPDGEQLVATGEQEVACMRRVRGGLQPEAWPPSFVTAVERFAAGGAGRTAA